MHATSANVLAVYVTLVTEPLMTYIHFCLEHAGVMLFCPVLLQTADCP
jgi:hypothetical protein